MERFVDLQRVLEEYSKIFQTSELYRYEKTPEDLTRELIEDGTMELAYIKGSEDGEIHAFCFFYQTDIYSYYVEYLGVPDRFQGRGIGKILLNSVVDEYCFSDPLIENVSLLCPDDKVSFYEKNGFRFTDKETHDSIQWNKMIKLRSTKNRT